MRAYLQSNSPLDIKLNIFQTSCLSVLLYGCESWILTKDLKKSINAFATSCFRIILHIKRTNRVPNTELYRMVHSGPLASTVLRRQLTFLGHLLRTDSSEPAHIYAQNCPHMVEEGQVPSTSTTRGISRNVWVTILGCLHQARFAN